MFCRSQSGTSHEFVKVIFVYYSILRTTCIGLNVIANFTPVSECTLRRMLNVKRSLESHKVNVLIRSRWSFAMQILAVWSNKEFGYETLFNWIYSSVQ